MKPSGVFGTAKSRSLLFRTRWAAYQQRLAHSDCPILVGPYHGEVGFEVLYWIPWLLHLRNRLKIAPERLIPISRGGSAAWYQTPTGAELYAIRTPQQVRVENRLQFLKTGMMKQLAWTDFDRGIVKDVAETFKLPKYLTLHPSWMYRELMPFFAGQTGFASIVKRATYEPWTVHSAPDTLKLPKEYAAVRFYFRPTFPMTEQTKAFCQATVNVIAQHTPVVLLTSGVMADDHVDFLPTGPNILRLDQIFPLTPETNLMVQSAVIARSVAYVGTYGGMAQLALRLGRPTVSFFTDWHSTSWAHRHLTDYLASHYQVPFYTIRLGDLGILQRVLPEVILPTASVDEPLAPVLAEA